MLEVFLCVGEFKQTYVIKPTHYLIWKLSKDFMYQNKVEREITKVSWLPDDTDFRGLIEDMMEKELMIEVDFNDIWSVRKILDLVTFRQGEGEGIVRENEEDKNNDLRVRVGSNSYIIPTEAYEIWLNSGGSKTLGDIITTSEIFKKVDLENILIEVIKLLCEGMIILEKEKK